MAWRARNIPIFLGIVVLTATVALRLGVGGSHAAVSSHTAVSPTSELRCAIPPVPEGLQVDLTVTLPRGVAPSRDDSPRLSWTERDYRWIGTAWLPAAPG